MERDSNKSRPAGVPWPVVGVLLLLVVAGGVAVVTGVFGGGGSGRGDLGSGGAGPADTGVDNQSLALSDSEAKYLQDAEHLGGFVLGDLTLPQLSAAIREGNASELGGYLAKGFQAELFVPEGGQSAPLGVAEVRTWKSPRDKTQPLASDGFVKAVLGWRNEFLTLESASLKVMLMRPETHGEFEGPWVGSLKLRMTGVVAGSKISEREVRFRCRLTSLTEDQPKQRGWLAECVAYEARVSLAQEHLLEPMQDKTGIDVSGLHDNWKRPNKKNLPFLTGGTYLSDYDRDGLVDVLITDLTGLALYHGEAGGRFSNVTLAAGLPPLSAPGDPPPLGAVFADFNNDGFPDLLLGAKLFQNVGGTRFQQLAIGRDTSLRLPPTASQFSVADFDGDGNIDLYVVGLSEGSPEGQPWIGQARGNYHQLWKNRGDWKFEEVAVASGVRGRGGPTFAAVWFDANGDGWPDLMTSCETGKNDYLINQRDGTFVEAELPDIYGGFSMGITAGDIDNDGWPDIYVANMYSKAGERIVDNLRPGIYSEDVDAQMRDFVAGNELYRGLGKGKFSRIGQSTGVADVGWAYGPGLVDLDNDGWLDLYAPVGFQSVTPERPDG